MTDINRAREAKGISLNDVASKVMRNALGTRAFNTGVLAIDAAPADVQTTNAVEYCIDGVAYQLAAQAAIDVSALSVLDEKGEAVTGGWAVLPDGWDAAFLLCVDAAGTIFGVQGKAVAAGGSVYVPGAPDGYCPFGAVKVQNASGSDFTFGTTSLAAGGITDTFFDLSMVPAGAV